jgi:hypothetical protein
MFWRGWVRSQLRDPSQTPVSSPSPKIRLATSKHSDWPINLTLNRWPLEHLLRLEIIRPQIPTFGPDSSELGIWHSWVDSGVYFKVTWKKPAKVNWEQPSLHSVTGLSPRHCPDPIKVKHYQELKFKVTFQNKLKLCQWRDGPLSEDFYTSPLLQSNPAIG